MTQLRSNTLLKNFNRAARRFAVTALLAATALTFAGDGHAEKLPPAQSAAVADAPVPQERLTALRNDICRTPLGAALLQFADANKIALEMSNSKKMDDDPGDAIFIRGLNHVKSIELNNEEPSDKVLMYTLVHELRHSWHRIIAHANDPELLPKQGWIRDRVLEADCFSFEIHFGYEYAKECGIPFDPGTGDYAKLAKAYADDRDKGMPPELAYGRLMARAFPHVHSLEYDDDFLAKQLRNWEAVVKTPCLGVTASDNWDKEPDAVAFAQLMRRATTVGLDLDKGLSALADWSDADFQSLDKTGGATPENLAKLAKADGKLGEAKTAWDVYIKDLTAKFRHERELREANGSTAQPKAAPAKAAL